MNSENNIFLDDAQLLLQSLIDNPNKEFIGMPVNHTQQLPPELPSDLSSVKFQFLYKIQSTENGGVWKGETKDNKYVTIETLNDYVAFGIGYTSYERDNNIRLVGLGNHINMQDINVILNKLNIKKPDDYHDFGW